MREAFRFGDLQEERQLAQVGQLRVFASLRHWIK
jgi:hypothetical protein